MSEEIEIWKDIPEYEGYYQVSTLGRVRGLDRTVENKGVFIKRRGQIMTEVPDKIGYPRVVLTKMGISKTIKVHSLVAITFLGHSYSTHDAVVDHINNDKKDNRLVNLQVVSTRVNVSKDRSSATGVTGVYVNKRGLIIAMLYHKRRQYHLGVFSTISEAAEWYEKSVRSVNEGGLPLIKRHTTKTGLIGVSQTNASYTTHIKINGKSTHVGVFKTPEEAAIAYDRKAIELRGEGAKLNFPITDYIQP